uniref:Small ribosomal subunit protein uS9c n=1 Tax=Pyramimonas parkeae TaxID=36894 RepID=A0A1R7T0R6_9CHLO|nr:ribosomal protein S9 [Pyramimonas parkeae]
MIIATGRRKKSTATVKLTSAGYGETGISSMTINGIDAALYMQNNQNFPRSIQAPLEALGYEQDYRLSITCSGGGLTGQAEAIQLGLARALCLLKATNRPSLKASGYLTRDPRSKERKKYGLKKARKASQFSKR